MRFVTLKSEAQLDIQTLHRVRDQLVRDRTSLMNQLRSLLLKRGHIVPQIAPGSPFVCKPCLRPRPAG